MKIESETTAAIITRVPNEMKRELVDRAREHDRSLSGEVRVLLRAGLERDQPELPEAAA